MTKTCSAKNRDSVAPAMIGPPSSRWTTCWPTTGVRPAIARRFVEIVIADDAFDLAEAGNVIGDVVFQVDVIEAGDDGLPHQHLPLFLGAGPAAAVGRAAESGNHRAGPLGEQALEVGGPLEKVEAHLDQLGAALGRLLNLG